jgi:hypothetical protein
MLGNGGIAQPALSFRNFFFLTLPYEWIEGPSWVQRGHSETRTIDAHDHPRDALRVGPMRLIAGFKESAYPAK